VIKEIYSGHTFKILGNKLTTFWIWGYSKGQSAFQKHGCKKPSVSAARMSLKGCTFHRMECREFRPEETKVEWALDHCVKELGPLIAV